MQLVRGRVVSALGMAGVMGVVGVGMLGARAVAAPPIYADSIADFSGVQLQKNWYYGFYNGDSAAPFTPLDFELMPTFDGTTPPGVWYRALGAGGYWTAINSLAMHPNGSMSIGDRINEENWAVRRWVSSIRGPLRITGHIADVAADGGDGVRCKVFVQGVEVWSHDLDSGDLAGVDFDIPACMFMLAPFDFAVGPRGSSDFSDGTYVTILVKGIIEEQPHDAYACDGKPVMLTIGIGGTGTYTYTWRHNGLVRQPQTTPDLTILNPTPLDAGTYSCTISDTCGSVTTDTVMVTVCAIDLNCDTFVDFNDYLEYLNRYDTGDPRADLNQDGFVDFADYLEFLNRYDAGC